MGVLRRAIAFTQPRTRTQYMGQGRIVEIIQPGIWNAFLTFTNNLLRDGACAVELLFGKWPVVWDYFKPVLPDSLKIAYELVCCLDKHCKKHFWPAIGTVATLGCIGWAARWFRSRYLEGHNRVAPQFFDGKGSTPMCMHCQPAFEEVMDVDRPEYEKVVLIPECCSRCSLVSGCFPRRACKVRISFNLYKTLVLYGSYVQARERDIHTTTMTFLDSDEAYDHLHPVLMEYVGRFTQMENQTLRTWYGWKKWSTATGSYCLATPWKRIPKENSLAPPHGLPPAAAPAAPPPPPSTDGRPGSSNDPPPDATNLDPPSNNNDEQRPPPPPPPPGTPVRWAGILQKRRRLWDWIRSRGDLLPQVTVYPTVGPVLLKHCKRAKDLVMPRELELDKERPADFRRPMFQGTAKDLLFEAKQSAVACGPVVTQPQVHDIKDGFHVAGGVEDRTLPDNGPDGQPLHFKADSEAGKRLLRWWGENLNKNFTTERILKAYDNYFGEYGSLEEIAMANFTPDQIRAAVDNLEVQAPQMRKANGKLEIVEKKDTLKPVRLTYDNGIELMALSYVYTKVFQELMYGKDLGLFYDVSIKNRSKEEVMKFLLKKWMKGSDEVVAFEIDQTGMERHERGCDAKPGLMSPMYKILQKICATLRKKLCGALAPKYHAKLAWDHKHGMCFGLTVPIHGRKQRITVKFPEIYMDSGWTLTSGGNFANEFGGMLATMFKNPEHVFATKNGKLILAEKDEHGHNHTFDWKFKSIPLILPDGSEGVVDVVFKPSVEGDDGGGTISAIYAVPENERRVIAGQTDLGYQCKLKFIKDGRLEFIGVHVMIKNGRPTSEHAWIPGLMRSLGKLGAKVGTDNSIEAQLSRFASLASMFAGRCDPMATAFMNSADRLIDQAARGWEDREIEVREWSEEWKAGLAAGKLKLGQLVNYAREKIATEMSAPLGEQVRMMSISAFEDFTSFNGADYARMQFFAEALLTNQDDDEAAWWLLPDCMKS